LGLSEGLMADIEIDKVYDGRYLVLRLNRP
jgi:hypothetical protein